MSVRSFMTVNHIIAGDSSLGVLGTKRIVIVPGGTAYSRAISLIGSTGWSATLIGNGTIGPQATLLVEYTDWGEWPSNPADALGITPVPPSNPAKFWFPWISGINPYADGRYEDAVKAKWIRFVFTDIRSASSGEIDFAITVRRNLTTGDRVV